MNDRDLELVSCRYVGGHSREINVTTTGVDLLLVAPTKRLLHFLSIPRKLGKGIAKEELLKLNDRGSPNVIIT